MKIVLAAINAKYIHSNLAVYSLKTFAEKKMQKDINKSCDIIIKEFTINQQTDEILDEIYQEKAEVICFSCYIWNISIISMLIKELKQLLPDCDIWTGGPEVSYDAENFLQEHKEVLGVLRGEGEQIFTELCNSYTLYEDTISHLKNQNITIQEFVTDLKQIKGITFQTDNHKYENPPQKILSLSEIPFPYAQKTQQGLEPNEIFENLQHRIIYYESSRGCPFSCSYCLSSLDKSMRFRDLELVKGELQFFLNQKVKQVKFVDRTFNCKKSHSIEIWNYLLEHDNGITNFHFEISADLLGEEEISILKQMRPGLVQLEIGVQSTNEETIRTITRKMKLEDLKKTVTTIREFKNINLHLDLIAGLPYENISSFEKSFCEVYKLHPEQLQLGFLKVLKGSAMQQNIKEYGLVHKSYPPYEVMYTKWLSYEDILVLKMIETMVEDYYNSGQFTYSLCYLESFFDNAYQMFYELGRYEKEKFQQKIKHGRIDKYYFLLAFFEEIVLKGQADNVSKEQFCELLVFDLYLRENMKTRPAFARDVQKYKQLFRKISKACGLNQQEHVEIFSDKTVEVLKNFGLEIKEVCLQMLSEKEDFAKEYKECMKEGEEIYIFDYQKRNPLNYNCEVQKLC